MGMRGSANILAPIQAATTTDCDLWRRPSTLKLVRKSKNNPELQNLLAIASRLTFQPHRIAHLLDAKGRHELELPKGFPFVISLFHFRAGAITQRLTWHQRLELLVPLDGPLSERMGDRVVELQPGEVLVVDQLTPHQVVDVQGLDTRALILSILPECVFTPGSPPTDHAFLLPFHRKSGGPPRVLRLGSEQIGEAHEALARLLLCHFDQDRFHRDAGCKAWLLVLLNTLIREFRTSSIAQNELLLRQEQVTRLKPVFDLLRERYHERVSLQVAAGLCGMSTVTFGRAFKQISGMTLGGYLNHIRMTHAVELLEDTRESITQIAFRLGFSDQSHFDRRFRRTFGRTPNQHRAGVSGVG